ncbi:HAD family hydrolase [Thermopolyspora sp. NPDC052614]|uniref:HAD family hydrolase n=1 Tax=Thermopolyspora sp. NPDC052614 TaxID=3155682 RepID=UPI0034481FA5
MTLIDLRRFSVVIFETDGVLTDTARIHAAAWKRAFDDFLRHRPGLTPEQARPFDVRDDYLHHLDGRPRLEGARSFLAARGVTLPPGPEGDATLSQLGEVKDALYLREIRHHGVAAFPSAMALVRELHRHGARQAAISPSRNCAEVLARSALADLIDARVDGTDGVTLGLPPMPDPAIPVLAAHRLRAEPYECVVVVATEPALQAAVNGRFGLVVAVRHQVRSHPGPDIRADCEIDDLAELQVSGRVPLLVHGEPPG